LRAHSVLQLRIVLHDKRCASLSGHGCNQSTLQG
jgi:hypothetical protein